jgi:hypothetical protein
MALALSIIPGTRAMAAPIVAAGSTAVNVAQEGGFLWESGSVNMTTTRPPGGLLSGPSWILLDAGADFALAINQEGALWGWGSNYHGELGDGTTTSRTAPARIGTASDWRSVSAQSSHSLAIKTDGSLWGWGMPYVGYETGTQSIVPLQLGAANNWKSIAAGQTHDLAIREDGTLWAWGYNSHGSLGDGTTAAKTTPIRVGLESNWASVTTSTYTSFALKTDGSLWVWGANDGGIYGNGPGVTFSQVPTRVGTDNDWRQISGADNNFILAIKLDGSLWSWGTSSYGGLGLGNVTTCNIPTRVGTGSSWTNVAAGGNHVIATQSDGSLWVWGNNTNGQLGVTGITKSMTPINVTNLYVPSPGIDVYLSNGWRESDFGIPMTCKTGILQEPTLTTLPVRNKGLLPLVFSEIVMPAGLSVVSVPAQVDALSTKNIQIRLDGAAKGSFSGVCRIRSNHPTVPEFLVNLEGTVVSPADDTDEDGLNDAAEVALAPLGFFWNSTQTAMVSDFFLKAGSCGLHRTGEVQECGLLTPAPVVDSSSSTFQAVLGLRNSTDSSAMPIAPGDLSVLPENKLGILLPLPAGRGFVRINSVEPSE